MVNTYTAAENSASQKNSQSNKMKSFRVRDKRQVCVVHLPTDRFQLGKVEIMIIDFRNGEQHCLAVKSSLMVLEKKTSDDSVLQVIFLARASISFIFSLAKIGLLNYQECC
jgi:hypothetical protein